MRLLPFNADCAPTWWNWYHKQQLARFFRGFVQGVTIKQCAEIPAMMRSHILMGISEGENEEVESAQKIVAGQFVGAISLADIDPILRIYRLGLLVDPGFQQQNFGRQLLDLGVKWAFNKMNAHKIVAEVLVDDERIIRGAKSHGFISEGINRKSIFLDGKFYDQNILTMLQEDYRRLYHV